MNTRTERAVRSIIATRAEAAGDWQPHHWSTFDADVDALVEEIGKKDRRAERAAAVRQLKGANESPARKRPKPDPPELVAAKKAVRERSGGVCEARTPWCYGKAREVHHRAGRGFYGCHHPDLLLHVCGHGNIDGCHGYIEGHASEAMAMGWRLPWGTRAEGDPWRADHRPTAETR